MSLYSIKNQKEFDFVKKRGIALYSPYFVVVFAKNCKGGDIDMTCGTFLGMKVSRRFSKKAVIRNKAKRRIRHLVQFIVDNKKMDTDALAMVIIPHKGMEKAKFTKLQTCLIRMLLRFNDKKDTLITS